MNRMFFTVALLSALSLAAFAQTPTPPSRTTAAPAAAAATGGTGAEGKIAVLNTAAFRVGLNDLKVKLDALNTEFEPKRKELEALQADVENLKNKINTQGATVSAAVRNGWVEEGTEKERRLKRLNEDYEALGQKRLGDVQGPVYDKVGKLLETYCQQRGIVLVIEAGAAQQAGVLLFASATSDITEDFMKEYNKANPGGAAPAAAPKK
ncbi:MAG: OmpH family outer membrane protein [Acidobacteria bacterium]|nr:OmpH family outer membrane protein [Acidobacteriota bacterium]MBI3425075.1 OmpH family outer membrane protein [Acidobacteriota bacterium]